MAKLYEKLDERLQEFILEQQMFFVASAPISEDGLVNISPKGLDTLQIIDSKTVAYLDLTGSGVESIAHIKENGRFVMMFCSYDKNPLILRLHGKGSVIEKSDAEWDSLRSKFQDFPAIRAIIKLSIERIADSCGWGVPLYEFMGTRDQYFGFADKLGEDGLRKAQLKYNMASLDGLPALDEPSA